MSDKYYHITSASGVEPRLDVDKFAEDKAVLNIYLLALARLQLKKQDDVVSFFQISGMCSCRHTVLSLNTVVVIYRNPWSSIYGMERRASNRTNGILHAQDRPFPNLASRIHASH